LTHDRSERVPLPASESRCEPQRPCVVRARCARYQAALLQGGRLEDFTTGDNLRDQIGGTAQCPGYVDTASLRKAHAPAPSPKPPMRGLG